MRQEMLYTPRQNLNTLSRLYLFVTPFSFAMSAPNSKHAARLSAPQATARHLVLQATSPLPSHPRGAGRKRKGQDGEPWEWEKLMALYGCTGGGHRRDC